MHHYYDYYKYKYDFKSHSYLERCSETNKIWKRAKCITCAMVLDLVSKANKGDIYKYVSVGFVTVMSCSRILQSR